MLIDMDKFDVGRVYEGALSILENIGVEVESSEMLARLNGRLPVKGNRVFLPRQIVQEHLDGYRNRNGFEQRRGTEAPVLTEPISIRSSCLNYWWHDPSDGTTKPFTTESVIENTKLLQKFARQGDAIGTIAGIPQDIPGAMHYVMAQYLNCVYNPHPSSWGIFPTEDVLRYGLEMSEILGFPTWLLNEMISPLKLVGQSVDLTLKYHEHVVAVTNDPMPILGVTAPADWHMAWAQSVAENLACYTVFRLCGVTNMGIGSFRLFVPNPSTVMTYFSSPMHIIALLTRRKVRWELLGEGVSDAEVLLINSKVPDHQAAAEKMAGFALAKAYGFPALEGAGGLFMDEIFSPDQMLIDIELKNYVNGVKADFTPAVEDILSVVGEGVTNGSFLASGLTLDGFYDFAWKPRLFDMRTRASWDETPKDILKKTREILRGMEDLPAYELEGDSRVRLEALMEKAKRQYS